MKYKFVTFLLLAALSIELHAQSASDIYVGEIQRGSQGLSVVNLQQVTDNGEYSNQPYFFDDNTLYFTQAVKSEDNQKSQMDIFRYDLLTQKSVNITNSSDSEYSATPSPDGSGFSVIKVNAANKQELWQITFSGQPIKQLANAIEPVGYQVWTQNEKVLLFVLGEPHTLRLLDPFNAQDEGLVVDSGIGPSLFRMPHTEGFTYTLESSDKEQGAYIWWYSPLSGKKQKLTKLPKGATYYAWTPNSELLVTKENKLLAMPFLVNRKKRSGLPIESTVFSEVGIDGTSCDKGISRLAVSPYYEKIALVCTR